MRAVRLRYMVGHGKGTMGGIGGRCGQGFGQCVHAKIHVLPCTNEWEWMDTVGHTRS